MTVLDVKGASASPLDQNAYNVYTLSGSTSPSTGTTAVTSQSSEIVVAAIGWNGLNTSGGVSVPLSGTTAGYAPPNTTENTAPFLFGKIPQ